MCRRRCWRPSCWSPCSGCCGRRSSCACGASRASGGHRRRDLRHHPAVGARAALGRARRRADGADHFVYQRLHRRIIEVGRHPDGSLRDRHLWQLPPLAPQTFALRLDEALDFAQWPTSSAPSSSIWRGILTPAMSACSRRPSTASTSPASMPSSTARPARRARHHAAHQRHQAAGRDRAAPGRALEGALLALYRTDAEALAALARLAALPTFIAAAAI